MSRARKSPPRGVGRPSKGVDARSVTKTVKLTPAEEAAQLAAARETPWATWAHDTLVAAAPPADTDEE